MEDKTKTDAAATPEEMVKKVEPYSIKLSPEFCGAFTMSINRFEYAYAIVEEVDSSLAGLTPDQFHFNTMASGWAALEKAGGRKIFVWHLNGTENPPCGAAYNNDEKPLCPGEPSDCLDHKRFADTLKKSVSTGMFAPSRSSGLTITSFSARRTSKRPSRSPGAHVEKYC